MTPQLKPIAEQTIVITGASSGIGLPTVRMAADHGAGLVLAARSEDALRDLTDEIEAGGGAAEYVIADVSDRDDVREIRTTAVERFGGFDIWVNGAAVSIYGLLTEVLVEDMRRQFDTKVWGDVYGSLEAADPLRERAMRSSPSEDCLRALDLAAGQLLHVEVGREKVYRHAAHGTRRRRRARLRHSDRADLDRHAVSGTCEKLHGRSGVVTAADLRTGDGRVRTILHSATHGYREVIVRGGSKLVTALGHYTPGLLVTVMERVFAPQHRADRSARPIAESGLEGPSRDLEERGDVAGHVSETSLYMGLVLRRTGATAAVIGPAATAA